MLYSSIIGLLLSSIVTKPSGENKPFSRLGRDVTPSKLLNVRKEETYNTYENRLIYTLVQNMKRFIKKKKENLGQYKNDANKENDNRDNKSFEYSATSTVEDEQIEVNLSLNSKFILHASWLTGLLK